MTEVGSTVSSPAAKKRNIFRTVTHHTLSLFGRDKDKKEENEEEGVLEEVTEEEEEQTIDVSSSGSKLTGTLRRAHYSTVKNLKSLWGSLKKIDAKFLQQELKEEFQTETESKNQTLEGSSSEFGMGDSLVQQEALLVEELTARLGSQRTAKRKNLHQKVQDIFKSQHKEPEPVKEEEDSEPKNPYSRGRSRTGGLGFQARPKLVQSHSYSDMSQVTNPLIVSPSDESVPLSDSFSLRNMKRDSISVPPAKRRQDVVKEIVSTEKTYISILKNVITDYLIPLRSSILNGIKYVVDGKPISVDYCYRIFNNVEMIAECNSQLLEELKVREENWDETTYIGDLFLKWSPFFKLYTEYSQKYQEALLLIQKAEKSSQTFREFMMSRRIGENGNMKPPIDQLLITPVQRIPRYLLLLQQILKNTSPEHSDYKNLVQAIDAVEKVASSINDSMKAVDNFKQIMEIQDSFILGGCPDLVVSHRTFIRQGKVVIYDSSTGKTKKMHLFLFNDVILFAYPLSVGKMKLKGKYHFHKMFPTLNTFVSDLPDTENIKISFKIQTPTRTYQIVCDSQKEKDDWMNQVNTARDQQMEKEGSRLEKMLTKSPKMATSEEEMKRIMQESEKMKSIKEIEKQRREEEEEKRKKLEKQIKKAEREVKLAWLESLQTQQSTKSIVIEEKEPISPPPRKHAMSFSTLKRTLSRGQMDLRGLTLRGGDLSNLSSRRSSTSSTTSNSFIENSIESP